MKAGEWTLRSRRVVTPSGTRPADVLIRRESIAGLLDHESPEAEGVILDVGDLAVLPGLVALHRASPDGLDGSGFEAITREAAAGGFTTLIHRPSDQDSGSATLAKSLKRLVAAEGKIQVDCGLVVRLGHGQADRVESWIEAGVIGVEAVLDAPEPGRSSTEADLRLAMPILADLGRPLLVQPGRPGPTPSSEAELAAIRLLIRLCRETRCRVHLIDPSSSEVLPMIDQARADQLPLTVETGPGHLARFREGLERGQVDAVGLDRVRTDGSSILPVPGAERLVVRERTSLRLTLPEVWAESRLQGFELIHLARWMAEKPAEVVGLSTRKGSIVPGLDADFVVFDTDRPEPPGQVLATILRGTMIYQSGRFFEHPKGAIVLRLEETQPLPGAKA